MAGVATVPEVGVPLESPRFFSRELLHRASVLSVLHLSPTCSAPNPSSRLPALKPDTNLISMPWAAAHRSVVARRSVGAVLAHDDRH